MSTSFLHRLLRLKMALNVESDKEVAEALQISTQALTERKRRDSFPVDRVYALAHVNPKVNADWVLGLDQTAPAEDAPPFNQPTYFLLAAYMDANMALLGLRQPGASA